MSWAEFIFAHGAGAGMDNEFMQTIAKKLTERGVSVHLFDFPYMQKAKELGKRRPPDKMDKLEQAFLAEIENLNPTLPLFIGGKSMGGRVASMILERTEAKGCLCLGYPFHPPGKPDKLRTEHLETIDTPMLVIQGEKDTFGKRHEVESYPLSKSIEVVYLPDGDHSFKPPKRADATYENNIDTAVDSIVAFMAANK
ncbi:alpha/beta family hydrolase [Vibrio superstes]|uniref:Alpha/beta hydrolase n=1 Tax=Vibrio superstes NBRC 103154 TaxID=1219062 RepID=A0A511QKJ2_9VIBR|nr:alpha/beta family hydrolase [Vibrio superstes]GEM77819.1 alpha/beta hydrolase [Vibrio superstes NBRC 103154]